MTIAIDDSWATSGVYNSQVVAAVTCAVSAWNNATDGNGKKTGFFWIVDYEQQRGTADLLVVKNDALCNPGDRACIPAIPGVAFRDMSPPQQLKFHSDNVTNPIITPSDNCGRIAHEMAHKMGGHGSGACGRSILRGVNADGTRPVNDVSAADVMLVNQALNTPQQCTGVQGDGFLTEHLERSLSGQSDSTQSSNGPLATTLRRPDPFAAMVAASDPLMRFAGVTECRASSK